jgi:hypothetical protein
LSIQDISANAFVGINGTNTGFTFSARRVDSNGDGYLDMMAESETYGSNDKSVPGNNVWINNGNG